MVVYDQSFEVAVMPSYRAWDCGGQMARKCVISPLDPTKTICQSAYTWVKSFIQHLLSAYCVPGTVLGAEITEMHKIQSMPLRIHSLEGETNM